MKKISIIIALTYCILGMNAQNGTQPDSARVIVGSKVTLNISVLANDNLNASKNYVLQSVYKSTTSQSINLTMSGNIASYQDPQQTSSTDTFFYIAKDLNSGSFDTNYVVIRKSDLPKDLYPGDANKDHICNYLDVLNIGATYSKTGFVREGIFLTSNWEPLRAYDWTSTASTIVSNDKFSDANGDGRIDSAGDVGTIYQNYALENALPSPQYSPTGGETFTITSSDTFYIGASAISYPINVSLGSPSAIKKAYGIAFSIFFDTSVIKTNNIKVRFNNWFVSSSQNLIFSKENRGKSSLDVVMVRKNGQNSDAGGPLGIIDVVIEDILGLVGPRNMNIDIRNIALVDSALNFIPVTKPAPKNIIVTRSSSSIKSIQDKKIGYQLPPNKLIIEMANFSVESITISDMMGKIVYQYDHAKPMQHIEISTENWSKGVYFLHADDQMIKLQINE